MLHQVAADQMRRQAERTADADIDAGLAEMQRHELRVNVGEMQQRDLPQGLEAQQVGLRNRLRRRGAAQRTAAEQDGSGGTGLENVAAAQHCVTFILSSKQYFSAQNTQTAAPRRGICR